MWKICYPFHIFIIKKRTLFIMRKNNKFYHLPIMTLEKLKLFLKDNLISEIVRSCCRHEEDFLLLKHTPIVEEIGILCKFFATSISTIVFFDL